MTDKNKKQAISIRISDANHKSDLIGALDKVADKYQRSRNQIIEELIKKYVAKPYDLFT